MEIGSYTNSYSDIFENIASAQSAEIKKTLIMSALCTKTGMASAVIDSVMSSLGGYEPDEVIPEDSTISFHV